MKTSRKEKAEALGIKRYCKGRADKARGMLAEYYNSASGEDIATDVGDCIADLLHLCEVEGIDFLERYENGRNHFNAELNGGEHG